MRYVMKPELKRGNKRRKTRFLLFPKWIEREIRWLETATWLEVYGINIDGFHDSLEWIAWNWIEEEV